MNSNEEIVRENREEEKLTKAKLLNLLLRRQYREIRDLTSDMHPADVAEILENLDENNRLVVFRLLKKEVATEAFTFMSDESRNDLVEGFSDAEIVNTLEQISLDEAADMLEDMPASVVKRVLAKSSRQTRESLNKLLHYPEDSAGSIMTPEYVRLRQNMTVRDAFRAIREQGEDAETVYTAYVVEMNRLIGVVTARDLLLNDPETPITELMDDNVISVKVTDDQEQVARQMQHYAFSAMPVVDAEGMLVGIVTLDDALDVLTEESTEDMQKMAAIVNSDATASYFGTSVVQHAKQRIPWLLILMLSATFTGMVTEHYETTFASLPLLVSFMPMLMDTPGNCGNQTCTLMVRGLALGEITAKDFLKVFSKELRIALMVGAVLGVVNGARIYIMYDLMMPGKYEHIIIYAIVVSISLFMAVILAKLVGGLLPLAAKRLGADPAIMATPFITTIVDAGSLIIYFRIAGILFEGLV
ncbi:MAG: magnesium transporter [Lachnospiraceae bacterium]|nr:magnesium transporter [Lachnospiraceae bacterium]